MQRERRGSASTACASSPAGCRRRRTRAGSRRRSSSSSGSGLSWQDGAVCEVRAGDTFVHLADHEEHTLAPAPTGSTYWSSARASGRVRLASALAGAPPRLPWVEGRDDDPWDVEAEVGELEFAEPGERPANVVALDDVAMTRTATRCWPRRGLRRSRASSGPPRGRPPQLRSRTATPLEEEMFVVLEGDGTVELWPTPVRVRRRERESHDVRAGRRRRAPAGHPRGALRSRRARRHDMPRLRNPRAERHLLLPALEQGLLPRGRAHRAASSASSTRTASRTLRLTVRRGLFA